MSRHSPLPRETVRLIRACAEPVSAIARRLGVSKQTVSKIRKGQIHRGDGESREELVRSILSRSPLETHAAIAEQLGCHRETVRLVRFGRRWADVAPELERLDPAASGANCYLCCHWRQGAATTPAPAPLASPKRRQTGNSMRAVAGRIWLRLGSHEQALDNRGH